MSSIIQRKAKRAAEAKFETYVNGETNGFSVLVETAWDEAKLEFEDHQDDTGHGVFEFEVSAKDHPEVTRAHVVDVLLTMDDFKDDIGHVQVMQKGKDDEAKFEISIMYGNLRDRKYEELVAAHRTKKRRIEAKFKKEWEDEFELELATERAMEAERAVAAAEAELAELAAADAEAELAAAEVGGTLSGYPDDGTTPENATFEALLKAGTLRLKLVERPGHAPDQAVEPGPKGRKSDVFEHKDLFKQCNPRFFFNGEAKEWRRTAPEGWTGQPPAAA